MDEAEVSVDEAYADEMARFCLATGYTPAEYWNMEFGDFQAICKALEEQAKAQNKK